ncbi:MAG: rRNA pseudouridine synthase [Caulobacteraceae bacterium]|nr:rRNA pseudouridine synthase [Caulobacteraceae bacterium]
MAWTRPYEEAEPQRVNRWLAQNGVCSRREADDLIARGLVSIDGETVNDAGRKIAFGQTLTLADAAAVGEGLSVLLHKPVGIVSGQPEPGQVPAVRLLTRDALWGEGSVIPDRNSRLAPVGRLDRDSRGLLLLSEDGVVAKAVIGPQSELDKEYRVRVAGEITDRAIGMLRHGLELDGRKLRPAIVRRAGGQNLVFILTEGRNRQIRRMCELVDLKVEDLFRVRIGPLRLDDLPQGRWRPLTPQERLALIAGKPPQGVSGAKTGRPPPRSSPPSRRNG